MIIVLAESPASVPVIRREIRRMPKLSLDTLHYIVAHLRRVDQNNDLNLMTAHNLSIVWGACIFPSLMATSMEQLDTDDLLKKNQLVKVLIQRFGAVFAEAPPESSEC